MKPAPLPLFWFTDFGAAGPYVGQMEAAVWQVSPALRTINLLSDAPAADPELAAYLLAALVKQLPAEAVVVAVVDPGVGSDRAPLAVEADRRWLIGPDNGLLAVAMRQAQKVAAYAIDCSAQDLSVSFHGRDLFAPAAAGIAVGKLPSLTRVALPQLIGHDWPLETARIVYFDAFGNAFTGLTGAAFAAGVALECGGRSIYPARVFADADRSAPFWYRNSCGLVEIAWPSQSAQARLGLQLGDPVFVQG
jgi:S-adenosylmethionine hydrolase